MYIATNLNRLRGIGGDFKGAVTKAITQMAFQNEFPATMRAKELIEAGFREVFLQGILSTFGIRPKAMDGN